MSEFRCFSISKVKVWRFPSFLKTFWKIEKIEVFASSGSCSRDIFSAFHTFFIQMSECWCFSFSKVKIWRFPSYLKTFRKIERIEVFTHSGSCPRNIFCAFHTLAPCSSKWVDFDVVVFLKWKYEGFLQFWKLFKKSKKKWSFHHSGSCPRDIFCAFHTLAPCSSKWVNFDVLVFLKWKYEDQWRPLRKTLTSGLGLDDMSLSWPAVVQLLVFIYSGIQ